MALFKFNWLRRFMRRNTNPMEQDYAALWKRRLSICYGIFAWNAFGMVCYMAYTGRMDWAKFYGYKSEEESRLTPAQYFSTRLNVEKGKIIRYSGFTRVGEAEFDNTKKEESTE